MSRIFMSQLSDSDQIMFDVMRQCVTKASTMAPIRAPKMWSAMGAQRDTGNIDLEWFSE